MSAPSEIYNGDMPDADKLMAWFNWFNAGRAVKKDTYGNLKTAALSEPDFPFIAFAQDIGQAVLYTGDVSAGDEGFITLGGS